MSNSPSGTSNWSCNQTFKETNPKCGQNGELLWLNLTLLQPYKLWFEVRSFELTWTMSQLKPAISLWSGTPLRGSKLSSLLRGSLSNATSGDWADTPYAQGSTFSLVEKMQRHLTWVGHQTQELFTGIYLIHTHLCACQCKCAIATVLWMLLSD